jgi:hypothetical protein
VTVPRTEAALPLCAACAARAAKRMAARGRIRMNAPRFNGIWNLHRLTENLRNPCIHAHGSISSTRHRSKQSGLKNS